VMSRTSRTGVSGHVRQPGLPAWASRRICNTTGLWRKAVWALRAEYVGLGVAISGLIVTLCVNLM